MQDLKHLSRKKRLSLSDAFSFGRRQKANKRNAPPQLRLSVPTGKRREKLKHLLLFIALVLALTPVAVFLFKKIPPVVTNMSAWAHSVSLEKPAVESVALKIEPPIGSFASATSLLDHADDSADALTAVTPEGFILQYSVMSSLQKRVHDFMAASQVPYGVFVAIEPASGRILAMTSHSSIEPTWSSGAFYGLYPMASLFKIITASAALEHKKITPDSVIEFRGNSYSENPRYWEINPKGKNNQMNVTYAMGKSINPLYGRLACDIAGKASVMECVQRFGFNQALLPGVPVKKSLAAEPQDSNGLRLMGAGLDHEVKISPLHAAAMMAAIANGGRMMAPTLTDRVNDRNGVTKESSVPKEIRRLVTQETAQSLTKMLSSTVINGTSRRAFHDRRGRPLLNIDIAAKTGSINGTEPRGHYSWFAAFAPIQNPKIALVALVINQDKWKIKSAQVGEQALQEFFSR